MHVLDVYTGAPANDMQVELWMEQGCTSTLIKTAITNVDGHPPEGPILTPDKIKVGKYRVIAHIGDYYKKVGAKLPPGYYTKLTIEFDVYDATQPHHVPFQVTP